MKLTKTRRFQGENLGLVLLGVWLIATGLLPLAKLNLPNEGTMMALLAVAAGALLLVAMNGARFPAGMGTMLLAIWLVAQGLMALLSLSFPQSSLVMSLLALAGGVLIMLRR